MDLVRFKILISNSRMKNLTYYNYTIRGYVMKDYWHKKNGENNSKVETS